MRTKQEVINFLESKVGTTVPCPGRPDLDGQCVTLIKALLEFLGAPDPYKARGHAKTVISAYLAEGIADPGTGFLSVFSNASMGSGYGHIWVNAGDGAGTYYESNGAKPLIVTKGKTYSYDNVCNLDKYIKEDDMSAEMERDTWWTGLQAFFKGLTGSEVPKEEIYDNGNKGKVIAKVESVLKDQSDEMGRLKIDNEALKQENRELADALAECQQSGSGIKIDAEVEIAGKNMVITGATVDSNGVVRASYGIK